MAGEESWPFSRSIRYLSWGVPDHILELPNKEDAGRRLDDSFVSDNVADFDLAIVFLDGWSEIYDFEYADLYGVDKEKIKDLPESTLVEISSIKFKGRDFLFNLLLVNELNFLDRDHSCFGPLLFRMVTTYNWEGVDGGRLPVENYKTCN